MAAFDRCGGIKWTLGSVRWPRLLGPEDRLFVLEVAADQSLHTAAYSNAGQLVAGPVPGGSPIALGADGTVYALKCARTASETSELIAFSLDLQEEWRIEVGEPCPMSRPALSSSGVLFLGRQASLHVEILAVQTRSPGPANTAVPIKGGSNLGAHWVAPTSP